MIMIHEKKLLIGYTFFVFFFFFIRNQAIRTEAGFSVEELRTSQPKNVSKFKNNQAGLKNCDLTNTERLVSCP